MPDPPTPAKTASKPNPRQKVTPSPQITVPTPPPLWQACHRGGSLSLRFLAGARSLVRERFGCRAALGCPFGSLAALRFWFGRCAALASFWCGRCAPLWHLRWVGFLASPVRVGHLVESAFTFGGRMNGGGDLKGFPRGFVVGCGDLKGFPRGCWASVLGGGRRR